MSKKKLILSIDGGGVRGLFDLEIINFIEHHFDKKIHDIFDLVIGVSAGAVTACVIANNEYSDITKYTNDFSSSFQSKQPLGPIFETKYDGKGKTSFLKNMFKGLTLGDIDYPLVVLTATIEGDPVLFKSWNQSQNDVLISNVLDASTAAPIYFPPVKIHDKYYIDGGTVSNDPVLAGITTAREKWGEDMKLAVLSLGTAMATKIHIQDEDHPKKFGLVKWLMEGLVDILTRSNDKLYLDLIPMLIGHGNYLRVTSTATGSLDDNTPGMRFNLSENAKQIWEIHGAKIISWIELQSNS
jgi:patatin-like phospholipase/acyl hydrolase